MVANCGSLTVHELYQEISRTTIIPGRKYLAIEVSCGGIDDRASYAIPVIKYTF